MTNADQPALKKIRKQMQNDYPLIPSPEIEPEAKMLAIAWVEGYEKMGVIELEQKHKLASDIMNYARRHAVKNSKP